MKTLQSLKSPFYDSGRHYYFDNGQFGEKTQILNQDIYELLLDSKTGEIYGLTKHTNNTAGGQCLDSWFKPKAILKGHDRTIFEELLKTNNL